MRSFVVVVVLVLLGSGTGRADDRTDAESLFRIGAQAYKDGKYDAAAENFERAYELFKAPEIAFTAAQAHRLHYQGSQKDPSHVKRAIELYEVYIAATPDGAGKRKDAIAHRDRLKDVLQKLEAAGEKVVVAVKETPSIYVSVALETALITVDGKAVERYTPVEVGAGEHTVAVSADGYQPAERKVTVTKGQAIVPIELTPRPASVTLKTASDARLLVDGRPTAFAGAIEIPSGKRLLAIYARGKQPVTRELDLTPGQELTLDVPLYATARRRAVKWVWVGDGVLLASTLVTAGLAIAADGNATDLRDSADPLSTDQAARYDHFRHRRDNFRTASFVLGTATLATAATALWLYYFDRPSPDELSRPVERSKAGGFAPLAIDTTNGNTVGLSYAGGF